VILFDTDICIELLRGNKVLIDRRRAYSGDVFISFMTVAELYYGVENSSNVVENRLLVDKFLLTIGVIQSDVEIMRRFGELKSVLKKQHLLLPDADLFIAATALEKMEALITGNTKHFQRISGLKLENWIR